MSDLNLVLDPAIRIWVFLPIVIIAFLLGIIRHYIALLFDTVKPAEASQIKDTHALIRARLLSENGHLLPASSYQMRKAFFNGEKNGYFPTKLREPDSPKRNPIADPTIMTDKAKENATNVLPMMIIAGWINFTFSGFVTTRVPFPLTAGFKDLLQQDINILNLDASWVSSASWYFLNVFGLPSIYRLVLGEDHGADQMKSLVDRISGADVRGPEDMKLACRSAWEDLECVPHSWTLQNSWKRFSDTSDTEKNQSGTGGKRGSHRTKNYSQSQMYKRK